MQFKYVMIYVRGRRERDFNILRTFIGDFNYEIICVEEGER